MNKLSLSILMACVALSAFSGCSTTPDGDVVVTVPAAAVDFATNAVREYLESRAGPAEGSDSVNGGGASSDSAGPAPSSAGGTPDGGGKTGSSSGASAPVLVYKYGGFNGSRAVENPNCQIGSLRVTSDWLSFRWTKGGCETLGATSRDDYDHTVACVFYWSGKEWIGGKFEWISTSRTTRSFENIKSGYGGWSSTDFFASKRHGFCIVSEDGRKRSNFIED